MTNFFSRVVSASLSPNAESDDVLTALRIIFMPWKWKRGSETGQVEKWFESYGNTPGVTLFNSGRSALLAILTAFDIGESDEVIVQAFTCVAVPNSVIWAGATPVYADIDESYNLDSEDVENKITKKTKAIIVQHTFGIPATMDSLMTLAKKHHVILIEDCAHALGATYKGKKLGGFGDASFYSFGRDKAVSSVWGGAAMIRPSHEVQNKKLRVYHARLPVPGALWILQQLLHPVAFSIILPSYTMGFGKALLVLLQKLHLLSIPVYPEEKTGRRPADFPAQYPNALAALLLVQLAKLDRYTEERRHTAKKYKEALSHTKIKRITPFMNDSSYLRYPILVHKPAELIAKAKQRGILIGNWYHNVIDPNGVEFSKIGYVTGSCPKAEEAARQVINLPTRISESEAAQVMVLFGV